MRLVLCNLQPSGVIFFTLYKNYQNQLIYNRFIQKTKRIWMFLAVVTLYIEILLWAVHAVFRKNMLQAPTFLHKFQRQFVVFDKKISLSACNAAFIILCSMRPTGLHRSSSSS